MDSVYFWASANFMDMDMDIDMGNCFTDVHNELTFARECNA